MFRNKGEFYGAALPYVALLDAFAQKHTLFGYTLPDHICYKCGSTEEFEQMRAIFEAKEAMEYCHLAVISGRRIAYFKLVRWVDTLLGPIHFLELADQKPDNSQNRGFDHIEAYPVGRTYEEMVEHLQKAGEEVVEVNRPHHSTNDINIGSGFLFRCTREPLIEKIKRDEMKV